MATTTPATSGVQPVTRVPSIDAFRGFVMFLMLAEAMRLWTLHDSFPSSLFWSIVAFNTTHVPWAGCSLHDLIQPAFSFLAGASLPFSIASRRGKGESFATMLGHAIRRSLILIFLGIFLRSMTSPSTYWTFEDTLTQIGLGYTFLFLLAFASVRVQVAVCAGILVAFWAAFVLYPLPPPGFDYTAVGVPAGWPHLYSGFLAHFNMNSNLSWAFDTWFLNLFPRESPFLYNDGGWSTLSFVPTLATMQMGTLTGTWLKSARTQGDKLRGLLVTGVALVAAGVLLHWLGICPIVKRIWTSSYTLYSGGLILLVLAAIYYLMEIKGWTKWSFWLMVIGANSIVVYVMSWTIEHFVTENLLRHFGHGPFLLLGQAFEGMLRGATVLVVFWLVLHWMYKKRIFVRI
jgi:predicted acyltransferase